MIITFTGTNDFVRRSELRAYIDEFVKTHGDFGLERVEAGSIELGRLLESVASVPFLAEKRMMVLTGISENKQIAEHLDKLLEAVADTTELVIVEPKFDKRSSLYKTLKKESDFREFNALDDRSLGGWVVSEATARGGRVSAADAQYLLNRVGLDQLTVSSELDKLITYDPTVTRETIDLLTEPTPQSTVFNLLDAAFLGDHKRTMAIYQEQRSQQVEPQAIMGMLVWQLYVLAVVKAGDMAHKLPEEIAKASKLNPFVVRKTHAIARKLSYKQVKALVARTLELDIRLKSEPVNADDAVQHYLLTIFE